MTRPNIIFITTDGQRSDTINALDCPYMTTPNLDRLVREGVAFRNAFAPGAAGTTSRAAILTGMYAHNTGVFSRNTWAGQRTWIEDLSSAGYRCLSIGKLSTAPDIRHPSGFRERIVVEDTSAQLIESGRPDDDWGRFLALNGQKRPNQRHVEDADWTRKLQSALWPLDEQFHPDVFTANSACGAIANHSSSRPLFLHIGFTGPRAPHDPLARHLEMYSSQQIPQAQFADNELSRKPPFQRQLQENAAQAGGPDRLDLRDVDSTAIDRMRKHYFARVTTIDEQVGRIIAALEQKQFLDRTILVFSSWIGDMLGDHRLPYDGLMYDSVLKTPLIIADWAVARTSKRIDHPVSLIDLGPTLLEAAGVTPPPHLEGQSLLPHVRGGNVQSEDQVHAEHQTMVMIRNRRNKMVLYVGEQQGEIYDLKRDPNELVNLWDNGTMTPVKADLKSRMLNWLLTSHQAMAGHKASRPAGHAHHHHRPGSTGKPRHNAPHNHKGNRR